MKTELELIELEKILTFLGVQFINKDGKKCSNGHIKLKTVGDINNFFGKEVMTCGQFVKDIDWWDFKNNWNDLMFLVTKIGEETGFTLVMEENTSYWVNSGEYAVDGEQFGGYSDISNIYQACIEFISWNSRESKYFSVSGFWKDNKVKFSDYIIKEFDTVEPEEDIDIFYYGLNESEINQLIKDGWNSELEFVITGYQEVLTAIN